MRILLVDDDNDILLTYKDGLEDNGFHYLEVYTDPVKANSNYRICYYDLLLLDIRMPEMTGLELYEVVPKMDRGAKLKVCFITSIDVYYRSLKESFPNLQKEYNFIQKPISIDHLVKHLRKVLLI